MHDLRPHYPGVLLAVCFVGSTVGCAQSQLHGKWYPRTVTRVWSDEDGTRTETVEGELSLGGVVIRADGSFDFSRTILVLCEGFQDLRRAGDRVYFEADCDPDEASGYFEVESCEYTPTRSELILREYFRKEDKLTRLIFRAQLSQEGDLLYEQLGYGPGSDSATETATLVR